MFARARLRGIGAALPPRTVGNDELETRLGLDPGFIEARTGVRERRIAGEGETVSTLAAQAGREALRDAGIGAGDLDLIIVASSMPDMFFPASACLTQHALGASRAGAFDVNCACAGFLCALGAAAAFVEAGVHRNILVAGSETPSRFLNWDDYRTCILFGDGAGAAVVSQTGPVRIESVWSDSDGSGAEALKIEGGGSRKPFSRETLDAGETKLFMDGGAVFRYAREALGRALEGACRLANVRVSQLDAVAPHQSNLHIIQEAASRIDLPLERFYVNIARRGNTAAASVPIALKEARDEGFIRPGHRIGLAAYGAGLASAAAVIRWEKD